MLALTLSLLLAASPSAPWRWCEVGFEAQGFDQPEFFWVFGPNDVWVMSATKAAHFDGTRWHFVDGRWTGAARLAGTTWLASDAQPWGLYRFTAKQPEPVEFSEGLSFEQLQTVSAVEGWATGGHVAHFRDGGWSLETNVPADVVRRPFRAEVRPTQEREVHLSIPEPPLHVDPTDRTPTPGPEWRARDGATWVSKPLELPAGFGWNMLWSVTAGEGDTVYGLLPLNEGDERLLVQWRAGRIISKQRLDASLLGGVAVRGSIELWAAGRNGSVLRRQKAACPR